MDLRGPATVNNKATGEKLQCHQMTMIDPVTCWFKVAALKVGPTVAKCQQLYNMGLHKSPRVAWNPQSNVILERIHQLFGNFMRTFDFQHTTLHYRYHQHNFYLVEIWYYQSVTKRIGMQLHYENKGK